MKIYHGFFAVLAAALLLPVSLEAQEKYALVIGNGAYTAITKLNNPVNDANDMQAALEGLGFQVDLVINGTLTRMEDAVIRLRNRLSQGKGAYGFFYYAGHGVQSGGNNYLIPVDANIRSESLLRERALGVQMVLDEMGASGNALNLVVLDACRDNPFSWARSGGRGLTVVGGQPPGSIIVYATSAGSTAADGAGRNGLFTSHLLRHLRTPGLPVQEIFNRTGESVSEASGGVQIPAIYSQFFRTAYLGARPAPAQSVPPPVDAPATQTADPPAHPAPQIAAPAAPPRQPDPSSRMVLVEGGTFRMGSTSGDSDEKPVHSVTVKSFYMGNYEVTQQEWVEVMGSNPSIFKGDNLPVENVSWYEAVDYCNKRSLKEGLIPAYRGSGDAVTCDFGASGYRLPTEAEWEYAARGGNRKASYMYAGGNSPDAVAWYGANGGGCTHPVGTKQPNSLGLYDMSGNVFEWCWDRYGHYGSGGQTDPRGAASGSNRVDRGGSWGGAAVLVRSANRDSSTPYYRSSLLGFRLVRSRL
jgi:formylglycine-generating enzyme required for sulfatase activity